MAITTSTTVSEKTVEGKHRKVYGSTTLTGTYETDGFAFSVSEMSDNYFVSSEPLIVPYFIGLSGAAYQGFYNNSTGKMVLYAPGGVVAHTHTIPVTEGSAGTAVTSDAGTLNVNDAGDSADITVPAATATTAGSPEVANGTTLTGMVMTYFAIDIL